jgi:hypothetical protein
MKETEGLEKEINAIEESRKKQEKLNKRKE